MIQHLPRSIPLLPLRRDVLLPGVSLSLPVGRRGSITVVESLRPGAWIGVVAQRDPKCDQPGAEDVHPFGTYARVMDVRRARDRQSYRVLLEGEQRFKIEGLSQTQPFMVAEVEPLDSVRSDTPEAEVLAEELRAVLQKSGDGPSQPLERVLEERDPGRFADRLVGALDVDRDRVLEVLMTLDVPTRLRMGTRLLGEARALWELKRKLGDEVRRELGRDQREVILRQQLRAIQRELGEHAGEGADQLRVRLEGMELPQEVRTVVDRELNRLEAANPNSPDSHVTRNYLEWIADLPWTQRAAVHENVDAVADKLEADHYGLDDVKQRILEHLAVMRLSGNPKGSILCLVGPPGVGKTSLGQSIADATGRPFIRVALGGVRDEAEIRGHRRTYVGALPGRIINAMRKVKVKNPVIMLDEVDKLGRSWMGAPEDALLELLDPEQNRTFTDHYLELPFDLSEVLFIATANSLETMSPPLRDRMEIVSLDGYTVEEKHQIARRHLIPRQLGDHALDESALTIDDDALDAIIRDYTREAGVRQLSRELRRLCRALALEAVRSASGQPKLVIDASNVAKYLGRARFFNEVAERTSIPGVAVGLAYTPAGGDILFVETSQMRGKGALQITGQLGDVMQESAKAALSYVRSHADELGVDPEMIERSDIHIHVPAGAVQKDGPSAGVTLFAALASLLTGRRVRSDTAMTGECTLRGRVLPVGGIKQKLVAAHRAGIKRIVMPAKNRRDLDKVPQVVLDDLELVFADDMSEVLDAALEPAIMIDLGSASHATPV